MKSFLIASATAFSLLLTVPANADGVDHINFHRSEGESCSMRCGQVSCDDTSNTAWVCKAGRTAAKTDCVWHTTGVCTNNLPKGTNILKNQDKERENRDALRAKNEKMLADEAASKKAAEKKAEDDKKAADKKAADKKAADKKAAEQKAKDSKK
jgi:hypothetical protein